MSTGEETLTQEIADLGADESTVNAKLTNLISLVQTNAAAQTAQIQALTTQIATLTAQGADPASIQALETLKASMVATAGQIDAAASQFAPPAAVDPAPPSGVAGA